jgi:hypothetical protein
MVSAEEAPALNGSAGNLRPELWLSIAGGVPRHVGDSKAAERHSPKMLRRPF